ncbi:hypothetical protein COV56_02020, partial [Candidatus Kuenenbacteria bacterium CG11_big_fil_rev_8_21_14_0_20_37_9]
KILSLKPKQFDLLITSLILVIMALISVLLNLKPLIAFGLYLFIPSIFLWLREKKNSPKIFLGVIFLGVIIGFIFDFIVTFNKGWIVTRLLFPYKFFGVLPLLAKGVYGQGIEVVS